MINQQHPIITSTELLDQWLMDDTLGNWRSIAIQAAQWGADQELEACCEWFQEFYKTESWVKHDLKHLRTARRPKPLSLKKQALTALHAVATGADDTREQHQDFDTIRQALEALDD